MSESPKDSRLSFVKVAELQRRAIPHFHAVIRLDARTITPGEGLAPPQTNLTAQQLIWLVRRAAAATELVLNEDQVLRFGEQIDIRLITPGAGSNADEISGRQIASYLAKYVTKSLADFGVFARRISPVAIEGLDVTEHVRNLMKAVVVLAGSTDREDMLAWVHTLGFRGHPVSKSRYFSTTMTALRDRRVAWRRDQALRWGRAPIASDESAEPVQWEFDRLGHSTLGDRALVLSAFARAQQERITAREALREGT
jgi:hypothetical protein